MCICSQRVHFKMPRKHLRKTFNFNLRRQGPSQESIEENPPKQDSRTSPSKETLPLVRPTRAAKARCIQNLSKIIREQRSYDLNVQQERALLRAEQRVASESVEQREKRLEYMRRRAAHRIATESIEQRQQRLEKQRLRALRVASERNEQREQHLQKCPAAALEHGADECAKEIIIKTELEKTAQSCDYFVIEFEFNQVKEEPGLVEYAKSEPALLVKEEILEDSGEDGNEQQCVQGASAPAGTSSVNKECSTSLGDPLNIKQEPSDIDVGPAVLQHMDIHYTINELDVDAIKQEDALLSLDTEEGPVYN